MLSQCFQKIVVCTGTCGKTTTTSMLFHVFAHWQPSLVFGGKLKGNNRSGCVQGWVDLLVLESDESDGSHRLFQPNIGVITSCSPDHLEYYGSQESLIESMVTFACHTKELLVLGYDDEHIRCLYHHLNQLYHQSQSDHSSVVLPQQMISVGFHPEADIVINVLAVTQKGSRFSLELNQDLSKKLGYSHRVLQCFPQEVLLPVIGRHNIQNASFAAVSYLLDQKEVTHHQITEIFHHYPGVHRRLDVVWQRDNMMVIDDYAHNPEKIKAAITAVSEAYPDAYLTVVFEPHKENRVMGRKQAYYETFHGVNHLVIAPLYEPSSDSHSSQSLSLSYEPKTFGPLIMKFSQVRRLSYLTDYQQTGRVVFAELSLLQQRHVILVMGAGKSGEATQNLLSYLSPT
ncbi:MAG: Mur ligase family protein [Proteobacteria bacterium]|nr:Mur ligase family protein [Pseudomonadota bacterium]